MIQVFNKQKLGLVILSIGPFAAALAGELAIPHEFQANTPALASQVNANFSETASAVNDNNTRIAALESALTALTERVSTLEAQPQNNVGNFL